MTMDSTSTRLGSPLGILRNPANYASAIAGSVFELSVTISNEGNASALIQVSIDESTAPMRRWCEQPSADLALEPRQSSEILYRFAIPLDTPPGVYEYALRVDAPDHYPEHTPLLQRGQLYILPYIQETLQESDPTFGITPVTTAQMPAILQPGEPWIAQIQVYNRSQRVDRFRLTCPDFDPSWLKITYPEALSPAGMVMAGDGLELNPGATGLIQLWIQPSAITWAGLYIGTLHLYSENEPNLQLLDLVYLQVMARHQVDLSFIPLVDKIQNQAGLYEVRCRNQGNSRRELYFQLRSGADGGYHYRFSHQRLDLLPGEGGVIRLEVLPKALWKRSFYGRVLNFSITVADEQQLPLPVEQFAGSLVWEPRPLWQLWLVILTVLGSVALLVFLIWRIFLQPKPQPEILGLFPDAVVYQESNNDLVRLSWQVTGFDRLASLRLMGMAPTGEVLSGPFDFSFQQGLPDKLKPFCQRQGDLLRCTKVPTDARKPGDYVFELTYVPRGESNLEPLSQRSNQVRIEPIPQPEIKAFQATRPTYVLSAIAAPPNPSVAPSPAMGEIKFNWTIANIQEVASLQLLARSPDQAKNKVVALYDLGNPQVWLKQLGPFCQRQLNQLQCNAVPTGWQQGGDFLFALVATPRRSGQPVTQETGPVTVQPPPIPLEIMAFTVNGQPAPPTLRLPLTKEPPKVKVSWLVQGDPGTKVELLPAPGTVDPKGSLDLELGTEPATQTVTLQASDPKGNQRSRSLLIETVKMAALPSGIAGDAGKDKGKGNPPPKGIPLFPPGSRSPTAPPPVPVAPPPSQLPPQF